MPAVFIAIAAVFVVLLVLKLTIFRNANSFVRAKVVIPTSGSDKSGEAGKDSLIADSGAMKSFIPLLPTETLISTLTIDLDSDTYDDQVIAVQKSGYPYLTLIIGIYNPDTNAYDRIAELSTTVSRIRTFSYTGIDMTGDHKTALVYQGVEDSGTSVLQIYLCRRKLGNQFDLQQIGDFRSDGTIFVQQTERSDSYELSQSKGASFPVWVYSSDKTDTQNGSDASASLSQIQTEYDWSDADKKYVQVKQLRVTGSRIAAKELARIQDGRVETFANFLSGLWYKTTNDEDGIRYLFFDYENREIIFLLQDTEEVYSWEDSNLRRSGIYLSTVNETITSMQRRFDITLTGVDEVNVYVHDDVRMIIKENTLWDGQYRKMSTQSTFDNVAKPANQLSYPAELKKGPAWLSDDGLRFVFTDTGYKLTGGVTEENGLYTTTDINGHSVIQFRPLGDGSALSDAYEMKFAAIALPATKKRTASSEINTNQLTLTPVRLAPDNCYGIDGRILVLNRDKSEKKAK